MSKQFYPPEKRYKVTLYLKSQNGNVSSNMNNVGLLLNQIAKKRFKKWILLPSNDNTPDLIIRRSEIAFVTVQEAK